LRLAHGALDVKRTDVLPLLRKGKKERNPKSTSVFPVCNTSPPPSQNQTHLLEQGDEEVDSQHGVGDDLVLVHVNVTDSDGETKNLCVNR
jgi:hypothetical protein